MESRGTVGRPVMNTAGEVGVETEAAIARGAGRGAEIGGAFTLLRPHF